MLRLRLSGGRGPATVGAAGLLALFIAECLAAPITAPASILDGAMTSAAAGVPGACPRPGDQDCIDRQLIRYAWAGNMAVAAVTAVRL